MYGLLSLDYSLTTNSWMPCLLLSATHFVEMYSVRHMTPHHAMQHTRHRLETVVLVLG